jgi:hypothetical protein
LLLPFDLTLGIRDASQDGNPGPLFLIFLPLVLFYLLSRRGDRRPPAFNVLLFFVLAQFVFWTVGIIISAPLWQSRLLLPAFVALCPVLGWILEDLARFDHPRFSLQRLLILVLGGILLIGLVLQLIRWLPHQPWLYLLGGESATQNLERRLGSHYKVMNLINDQLPKGANVLFLWEPRSYYCDQTCQPDSILDAFGHAQFLYGDAESIASAWKDQGITHVLLLERGLDFVLEAGSATDESLPEPEALATLRENNFELVAAIGDDIYRLYRFQHELAE